MGSVAKVRGGMKTKTEKTPAGGISPLDYNSPQFLDNQQRIKKSIIFAGVKPKIMARPIKFEASFKARVAIEALQEKEPLQALAKKYGVSPSVISSWKDELLQNSQKAFESDAEDKRKIKQLEAKNAKLERKVGQLTLECDFFAEACEDAGLKVR